MKINAKEVIEYIESQGKDFPFNVLRRNTSIVAGGSIANAIISIWKGKDYPLNDFDIFVQAGLLVDVLRTEQVATVTDDEYPSQMTSRLHILKREQFGDADFITVAITDDNKNLREQNPSLFYKTVLNSFDLNCVQAGIHWDHERLEFVLVTTPEFRRFLLTNKVEIVNVHSNVTFLRMMKKADDLDATINVTEELQIIRAACNPEKLNELYEEQAIKHAKYIHYLQTMKDFVNSGLDRSDPDTRGKAETVFQAFYDAFAELGHLNKRPLKIKVLRAYIQGTERSRHNLLQMFDVAPYSFAKLFLSVEDILDWLPDGEYSKEEIREYIHFYIQNPALSFLLNTETFDKSFERMYVLKEHGDSIVSAFGLFDIEDRMYTDEELVSLIFMGKLRRKELDKLSINYFIEEAVQELNDVFGFDLFSSDLVKKYLGIKQ